MEIRRKAAISDSVYVLKIQLKRVSPRIWRRIEVPGDITLSKLHRVVQIVMGWENAHLHQFTVGKKSYGPIDPDYASEMGDERKIKLCEAVPREKSKFQYEYDFGDSWEHEVLVEKKVPAIGARRPAACLDGRRACPPEDVGGAEGYEVFLEALADPGHPEHDDFLEWVGEQSFDPEAFDVDAVNRKLKRLR
ncbi:MAG: plasmid pRiA4b ORF-3 family protein [Syntrophobacteraceae bacterium]|nr:plasmid pRiA4b ORF-3 family protein [Desulfobacteraceae bacterium]